MKRGPDPATENEVGVGDNYLHPEIHITLTEYDQWVWPSSGCGHCACGMLTADATVGHPSRC